MGKHRSAGRALFLCFAAAWLCGGRAAMAGDVTVDLQPHWRAGEEATYRYNTVRKQRIFVTMGGKSKTAHTTIVVSGVVDWKVDHVADDGSAQCTMTRKWMSATLVGPDGKKQVNDTRSGTSQTPPIYDVLQALTQHPIEVTLSAEGTVTDVSGLDAIRQQTKVKQLVPSRQSIERFATLLVPVAKAPRQASRGATWQYHFQDKQPDGTTHVDVDYRLTSLEKIAGIPVATIEGDGRLSFDFDRSKIPANAPPIDVSLENGSFKTQIMFDLSRHEAVGRHTLETRQVRTTVQIPNHTLERDVTQTVDREVLRIAQQ